MDKFCKTLGTVHKGGRWMEAEAPNLGTLFRISGYQSFRKYYCILCSMSHLGSLMNQAGNGQHSLQKGAGLAWFWFLLTLAQ